MDVATGALGSLLPKLKQLLKEEYDLQKGVKRQVNLVSMELEVMQPFLRNVGEVAPDMLDEQDRNWAREVREASYNIEDLLDTFLVSVDGSYEPVEEMGCGWLKRATKKMGNLPSKGRAHGDFAAAIEDMKEHIVVLAQRQRCRVMLGYRVGSISAVTAASSAVDPRLPALYRSERELVGIEEPREAVIRLLMTQGDDEKTKVKSVSIVGLGGVGKTTLAKAVYNRLQAQKQFDCSAFVSVSPKPDMKKVLMDILLELDEAKYRTSMMAKPMNQRQLIDEIRRFLRNKRYLIVIDDLWHSEAWEIIRFSLVDNHQGSRIIITSRNLHAAWSHSTYRLEPLSHVNSEKLFYKRIFGGEGNCPDSQMSKVSDKILKSCGGLPLAIITAACVLASEPWEEWSVVYNSVAMMRKGSNRYIDNMRMILSLSIHDLPSHLRTCLFHLSVFPEDCWIEKDFLIWKWVAEGFLRPREMMTSFETGEEYFDDLVGRGMIQIAEGCFNGHVYGCRVHPAVFSLIRSSSSEENFSTVLGDEHHHTSPGTNSVVRRIALHTRNNLEDSTLEVEANNMSLRQVRSFNASLCFIDRMPQLSNFQVLRVLALEYCPGIDTHHLKLIAGNLLLLRYLGLVGAGVLELPEAVGSLRFLQTLDLRETGIERWPSSTVVSKLQALVCLCVGRTRTVPNGMGSLRSLEDLRLNHVSGYSANLMAELGRLESLRLRLRVLVLGFEQMDVELEKALVESLVKLGMIQRLEIYCKSSSRAVMWEETDWVPPHIGQLVVGGLLFSRLPSWIHPSTFLPLLLSHLQLGVEVVEDGDLEALAKLPVLRSLMLLLVTSPASDEQEHRITSVVDSERAFSKLNFFSTNMAVRFQSGHDGRPPMPKLEHVELRVRVAQCGDSWLSTLANLPSLEKVTVVLDCRGVSLAETEEAEEQLRRATGIHTNRLNLEVTKEHDGDDEVPLVELFRFKNPRFEAMRCQMEKMQANRRVQVPADSTDTDDEIAPVKEASE